MAIVAAGSVGSSKPGSTGEAVGCFLMAAILILTTLRRWTAEIDLRTRTLKISRRSFGLWTKTTLQCSLDQCRQLGTIGYDTDGYLSYGVYVELTDGTRHAIPTRDSTFHEAGRVAARMSNFTKIPRLDIQY
jgi:hypothetical protein